MQPTRRVFSSAGGAALTAVARNPRAAFTCRGCLIRQAPPRSHQRRAFSGSAPRHASAPAGPSRAGLASLSSRKLISVSGPDAAKFLQGVVTANMLTPGPNPHSRTGAGFYAVFLTATGRILHDVFIYPDLRNPSPTAQPGESFLIEVDAAEADRLHRHIKRFKLRAKFSLRVLDPSEATVWHAWSDDPALPLSLPTSSPSDPTNPSNAFLTAPDLRAPNLGHRILNFSSSSTSSSTPTPPEPLLPLFESLPHAPESAYHLRRYLHGIPEGQSELLREQALPHESNVDLMGGIDFRKGCYVGQELTIRTEHRGVVRKRVLPCLLYPAEGEGSAVPQGLEQYSPAVGGSEGEITAEMVPCEASIGRVGKKGRSAGKWLRGVGNVGLALCRLEIMTDVVLPGESTGGMAFDAADEFVVGLGETGEGEGEGRKVKIKAFVPEWLREGLKGKEGH